jgi:putative flippase GtrA
MTTLVSRLLTPRKGAVSRKGVSFALIGVVNTIVDYAVFSIAWGFLGWSPLLSNLLAWFIAASGSYLMNCLITFAAESGSKIGLRTYLGFLASGVAGLIAGTAVLLIVARLAPVLLAKLIAMVASFALNFSLSHFLIFPPRETRH